MKQEAWVENKFDEVFAKKGKVEKANETKQNAKYTLTINIIKNKIPNVFARKVRFEKDDVKTLNVECTPTINTTVNTVTRNPKNTVKKP